MLSFDDAFRTLRTLEPRIFVPGIGSEIIPALLLYRTPQVHHS